MCGRFTLTAGPTDLQNAFPWLNVPDDLAPRYNIAPSQPIAVVPNDQSNTLAFFRWGLVPSWSKDPKIGNRLINARAETLAEKPSFRAAYRSRRCLVLADGFYEWRKDAGSKGGKTPIYIRLAHGRPFAFAGLWETWRAPDGETWRTCTIITTDSNELITPIHNRMPVILPPDAYEQWLDSAPRSPETLDGLLEPYPDDQMETYPVSSLVNSPAIDVPECVLAAA